MATRTPPPSRTLDQFVVRFPDGMRDKISDLAKQNGRSMNAEIIARLEQSFSRAPVSGASFDEMISRLDERGRQYFFVMYQALIDAQEKPED